MDGAVCREGWFQQVGQRLGPGDLVEEFHPLVVLDPVGLHLLDGLAACHPLLLQENGFRIVEDRFDHRDDVEGVGGDSGASRSRASSAKCANGWLRAKSSGGSMASAIVRPSAPARPAGDDAAVEQRSQESYAAARECRPGAPGSRGCPAPVAECGDRVAGAGDDVEDHRVVDPHPGLEGLGLGGDELVEGRLGPHDLPGGRLDLLDPLDLHRVVTGFGQAAGVLDQVLGACDHFTAGVVARPAGPPGDLVELRTPGIRSRVPSNSELGEEHGPDRHVDADAEGVGAGDDLEQAGLRELFHDAAISGSIPAW